MTLQERILEKLKVEGVPLDDDDLAGRLGVARAVNQAARRLERSGHLARYVGRDRKIVNSLTGPPEAAERPISRTSVDGAPSEDEVKAAVKAHLEEAGYRVTVAWGRVRGVDIEATRPDSRMLIEAKGSANLQPQQVSYFLGALGELIQRMSDPAARYGLALPDNRQYRGLVSRLPQLARDRLTLTVFFVAKTGAGYQVTEA